MQNYSDATIACPHAGVGAIQKSHKTFVGVQALRGAAALLVVIFHCGLMVRDRFPEIGTHMLLRSGAGGVDIFFPISGFVMLISTVALAGRPEAWRLFAERRLIRIVPLYWLATTLKIVAVVAVPALALHTTVTPWHSIASYLFIFSRGADGTTEPVVPVGWTLNYEMFFYAFFAAALFWRLRPLPAVSGAMLVVPLAGLALPITAAPLTVLNPIVLEFAAGMWIATLAMAGIGVNRRAAITLGAFALAALVATDALPDAAVEHARLLVWGVPGATLVFAAVSLEPWIGGRGWRLPKLLGDASYSLYLSHGFVLPAFGIFVTKAGLHGAAGAVTAFLASIMVSVGVGIGVYRWIERPMTRALTRRFKARAAGAPMSATPGDSRPAEAA